MRTVRSSRMLSATAPRIAVALAALGIAALLLLPAGAETPSPVDAALDACLVPDTTVVARLELLAESGWRTTDDTLPFREWWSIRSSIRFPIGSAEKMAQMRDHLIDAVSKPFPLRWPPGQALAIDEIEAIVGKGFGAYQSELSHPEVDGIMVVELGSEKKTPSRWFIGCSILLSAAHSGGRLNELVDSYSDKGSVITTKSGEDIVGVATLRANAKVGANKGSIRLEAREYLPEAEQNILAREAGFAAKLSLHVESGLVGFSLR